MNRHSVASGRTDGGKRERILDAAVKIFAEKGFYNAKVSDIARVAGVADGTIYLYFKSKDDLLISLFEDRMEQVNQNLRNALAVDDGPIEATGDGLGATPPRVAPMARLRRGVLAHFELVRKNPQVAEVLTVELRQSTKFLKEYQPSKFGEFLKLIAEPIEAGQRDGSIRADLDAPMVARALFGAIDEMTLAWVLSPGGGARGTRKASAKPHKSETSEKSSQPQHSPSAPNSKKGEIDLAVVATQLCDLFIEGLREPRKVAGADVALPDPGHENPNTKRRAS